MSPPINCGCLGRVSVVFTLVLSFTGCATRADSGDDKASSEQGDAKAYPDGSMDAGGSENSGLFDADFSSASDMVEAETSDSTVRANADAGISFASCAGTSAVQLSYLSQLRGSVAAGSEVMWENGSQFFLVTEDCTFYAQVGQWGPTTTGKLDEVAFAELLERLRIEELLGIPVYCSDRQDALQQRVEYRGRSTMRRTCAGPDEGSLSMVFDDVVALAGELQLQGIPISENVRFTLLHRSENVEREDSFYADAVPWPLGDPMDYADPAENEDILIVRVHEASGEEAEALRELRHAAVEKDPYRQFIPIVQADGSRFQLFMRDSLPEYEDEHGVLLP